MTRAHLLPMVLAACTAVATPPRHAVGAQAPAATVQPRDCSGYANAFGGPLAFGGSLCGGSR